MYGARTHIEFIDILSAIMYNKIIKIDIDNFKYFLNIKNIEFFT